MAVAFHPNGKYIALAIIVETITLWDIEIGGPINEFNIDTTWVTFSNQPRWRNI